MRGAHARRYKDGICVGNVEKKTNRHKDRKMSNKSNKDNKKKNQDNKISWFLFSKGGTCTGTTFIILTDETGLIPTSFVRG